MTAMSVILLTTFLTVGALLDKAGGLQTQKKLLNVTLGPDYDESIRPVKNVSSATDVYFAFWLKQLIDLDERKQILTTAAGIKMFWTDEHFVWNPDEHDSIKTLWVSSQRVWTPTLELWNNAGSESFMVDTTVSIHSEGKVYWDALVVLQSFCKIDFFFFPWDEQECTMEFGPWIMSSEYINMHVMIEEKIHLNPDINVGEFIVENVTLERKANDFEAGEFTVIVVKMHLWRQPLYYILNMIIPCLIIFSITLFGFILPPDSGEKVSLNVTILLSMSLFLGLSSSLMPPTSSKVPLIAQYNIFSMVLVTVSTIMTIYVLRIWHIGPGHKEVPAWIRKWILGYLVKVLCMEGRFVHVIPGDCKTYTQSSGYATIKKTQPRNGSLYENQKYEMKRVGSGEREHNEDQVWRHNQVDQGTHLLLKELKNISSSMKRLVEQKMEEEHEDDVSKEWKQVAIVTNRLFLWVYVILTVTTAAYFFVAYIARTTIHEW
ncbi:neuronal acetylcholine receptor subunit beta-3-like isoform X2 [Glandiceps talaboti]